MCRLTAYLGGEIPVSTLLFAGTHPLLEQSWAPRELMDGSVNADGWGVGWWREGRAVRLARCEPAWYDAEVRGVLESVRSTCGLAALRNGTPGIPLGATAVAPFLHERWAFALNGYVPDFRRQHMRALRADLPDHLYAALVGSSDTETLFLMALAHVEEGAAPAEALERVAARVLARVEDEGGGECQLTMMLADGERLAVTRTSNVAATNTLYFVEGGPLAPDGVLVASEALDRDRGWRSVPPHHLLAVDASGVSVTTLPKPS